MAVNLWSQTAANNATADPTVNWAEGQAPSSVNDSARAMMASVAKFRDDISCTLATGGTSTAYTLATNTVFASTSGMNGQVISFIITATNGASPTLNVDGLGAFPITIDTVGTAVPSGTMITNSLYEVVFYSSVSRFVLRSFYSNPYNVPLGGMMDFIGSSVPNSNFVFPIGQAISRVTYSTLFSLVSTTYGVGDGSTTFNVPDLTGRTVYMKEATATRLTTGTVGIDGGTLGASGGGTQTLITANLPAYTPAGSVSNGTILATNVTFSGTANGGQNAMVTSTTGTGGGNLQSALNLTQAASPFSGTAQGGTSTPIKMAASGIILNKILRIL